MKTVGTCAGFFRGRAFALLVAGVVLAIPWAPEANAQPRPFGISSSWTRSPYGDDSALAQRMRGSGTNFNIQIPPGTIYYPLPGPYTAYTAPLTRFGYPTPYQGYGYPAAGYNNWFPPAGATAYGWNAQSFPQAPVVFGPVGLGNVGPSPYVPSFPTYYSLPPVALIPYGGPIGYGVADFGFLTPWTYSVAQYSEVVIGVPAAGAVSPAGFPLRRRPTIVKAVPAFRDEFREWDLPGGRENPLDLLATHPAALRRILSEPELPTVSARPVQAPESVVRDPLAEDTVSEEPLPTDTLPEEEPPPANNPDADLPFPEIPDDDANANRENGGPLSLLIPAVSAPLTPTQPAAVNTVTATAAGISNAAVRTVAVARHRSPDPLDPDGEQTSTGGRRLGEQQAASATDAANKSRPNVVFIAVDDLNDWVGCLAGHPNARTPHIDRLAAAGTLFCNAHCQGPICGPSRASLLSGRFPHTTGVYAQPTKSKLADDSRHFRGNLLPEYFAAHGYRTLGGGKITHGYPMSLAFQTVGPKQSFGPKPPNKKRFHFTPPDLPFTGTQTDWGAFPQDETVMPDHSIASWAEEQLTADHDQPFFLAVGFMRPHVPFYAPQRWFDLFPTEGITLPEIREDDLNDVPDTARRVHELPCYPQFDWLMAEDKKQLRLCVQGYLASTSFVDHQIGRVIEAIQSGPHAQNTIVVLFGDHGYHLGEKHRVAKHSLWEEATRVPLIVLAPGDVADIVPAAMPNNSERWTPKHIAAATTDSVATGQKRDEPVGLIDLFPTLVEMCGLPPVETNEGRSLVPLMEDHDIAWRDAILTTYARGCHALRSEKHRYIRYDDGSEELYDHGAADHEWHNLANREDVQPILDRFRRQLPGHNAAYHPACSSAPVNEWFREHFRQNAVGAETAGVE